MCIRCLALGLRGRFGVGGAALLSSADALSMLAASPLLTASLVYHCLIACATRSSGTLSRVSSCAGTRMPPRRRIRLPQTKTDRQIQSLGLVRSCPRPPAQGSCCGLAIRCTSARTPRQRSVQAISSLRHARTGRGKATHAAKHFMLDVTRAAAHGFECAVVLSTANSTAQADSCRRAADVNLTGAQCALWVKLHSRYG